MAKRRNFVKTPSATGKAGHRATHSMKDSAGSVWQMRG